MSAAVQFGLTVLGGAIGSGITMFVGWRQFKSQKWWERKADAYTAILEAFQEMLDEDDEYWRSAIENNSVPPKDVALTLRKKAAEAEKKIERQKRMVSFLISKDADAALKTMADELGDAHRTMDWNDFRNQVSRALWKGFDAVKAIASRDLGIRR